MKKFISPKYLPIFAAVCCLLGFLLRLWTLGGGPNDLGLFAHQPVAWILLWIVTLLFAVGVIVMAAPLKKPGKYTDHFSASLPGAIGNGAAAVGVILTMFRATGTPSTVMSIVMLVLAGGAAVGMCLAAAARLRGNRQPFWPYLLTCLLFGVRLFDRCRGWSENPQVGTYIFPFLASASLLLAVYYLTAYQVNMGSRRICLFYSFSAIYLCTVSLAYSEELLFYLCMIVFLATNLPSLRPLTKRTEAPENPQEPDAPAQADAGKPNEMSYDELMDWLKNG